jgi:stage V sporulation protein G
MEITQVHIYPVEDPKVKGYASIVLDDCFLVNDIKIIHGPHGCFISMPSRRRKNGKFRDIAHPITKGMRERIEDRIFDEFEKVTGQRIAIRAIPEKAPETRPADPTE